MTARVRDERGAVLTLTGLFVVSTFVMVALVLDLGQLRTDRRINKSVTDVAARAGVARLPFGPWSGVCEARRYLLGNAKGFSTLDPGSETWTNVATPPTVYPSSPCPAIPTGPDATPCAPGNPSTWAKLQATAGGGRFTVEIQSGYVLPDPRFSSDAGRGDAGASAQGSCDNLAVIVTERRSTFFGSAAGVSSQTSKVRSVARLNAAETLEFVAALQLLELHDCDVLQTGGSNTRVISQAFGTYPGTVQIDSAADAGSCPQPIINAQATSAGPSVVACSANSANPSCVGGSGTRPSRIGVYALNFNRPPGDIATDYPSTYGDTRAVASPRTGRKYADRRYRQNVDDLDAQVKGVLTSNAGRPPGCAAVVNNSCTGNGVTWLVLQQGDCNSLTTFFSLPARTSARNIWFNCDLAVNAPLVLTAADAYVVVTGQLSVSDDFRIVDARKVYIGGRSTGNQVGLQVSGTTSVFTVNAGASSTCAGRTGAGHANRLVLGNGSFKVGSGGLVRLCQTFVHLASGYDKVPDTDGTPPCLGPCSTYTGTIGVSSGAFVDWTGPNEITGRLPDPAELATTNQFEDLALWTEAGGNSNSMSGGSATSMAGAFFLPNADSFNLAGGGSLPITLSAQFIATTLKVTGGATVNLVPNPLDSIPVSVYSTLLVR